MTECQHANISLSRHRDTSTFWKLNEEGKYVREPDEVIDSYEDETYYCDDCSEELDAEDLKFAESKVAASQ